MNAPATNFKDWMDSAGVSTKDACQRFGISKQTLYNWRSNGVPESKQSHVNYVISCWSNPTAAEIGETLLLRPTPEQYRNWSMAALQERKILEDWAFEGLDELAAKYEMDIRLVPKAAEEPSEYRSGAK